MSTERPKPERTLTPSQEFGFTRQEQLFDRVSHERLLEFLDDERTTVHRVEQSSNSYGEFLFVTMSRLGARQRLWVTFFGCGYHEYRERWLLDDWFWYFANALPDAMQQEISRDRAREQVQKRWQDIQPEAHRATQTRRGRLFEMLADLTDDDGALAEMEDLGDGVDWLADGPE